MNALSVSWLRRTWHTSWHKKHSMHFRNSCTRSTSSCCMRQLPSGASGGRGLNFLICFLTRKFHETSVTRSLIHGKVFIGSTVTGLSSGSSLSLVMHISRGMPLISAEHDPHLPALQFQRTAISFAWSAWILCTASRTTMPSEISVVYLKNFPSSAVPRHMEKVADVIFAAPQ